MSQFGTVSPLLDARLEGKIFTCTPGDSTHYYSFSHEAGSPNIDAVKFNGVSTYGFDSNPGDYVTMWTEYYVTPLATWKRYKKFGETFMIFPNTEQKNILFPTTPTNGVRLAIKYHNNGVSDVEFAINLYNFVDQQTINTAIAAEGEDW